MKILFSLLILTFLSVNFNVHAATCTVAGKYQSGKAYFTLTKDKNSNFDYTLELFDEELNCKTVLPSKAYSDMGAFLVTPRRDDMKERYNISVRNNCTEAQVAIPPSNLPKGCENFFTDPKDGRPWIFKKVSD